MLGIIRPLVPKRLGIFRAIPKKDGFRARSGSDLEGQENNYEDF
jgi:hypothetical protein